MTNFLFKTLIPVLILIPSVAFYLWYRDRVPVEKVLAHVNGSFVLVDEVESLRNAGEPLTVALDRAIDRRLFQLEAERTGLSLGTVEGFFDVLDRWNPTPSEERHVVEAEARISGNVGLSREDLITRMKSRAKAQYLNQLRTKAIIEKYIP